MLRISGHVAGSLGMSAELHSSGPGVLPLALVMRVVVYGTESGDDKIGSGLGFSSRSAAGCRNRFAMEISLEQAELINGGADSRGGGRGGLSMLASLEEMEK